MMRLRLFTPATARRVLPRVRPAAVRLSALYRALEGRVPAAPLPETPVDPTYFRLVQAINGALETIGRHGVVVSDLRHGRLEFPARRAGRPVLLSWHLGEPGVAHWREPGEAAARRRPVDEDGPWETD